MKIISFKSLFYLIFLFIFLSTYLVFGETRLKIGMYYPFEGSYKIFGSIKENEWKKDSNGQWSGRLFVFNIETKGDDDRSAENFMRKGFEYDKSLKAFQLIIKKKERGTERGLPLVVYIYGVPENERPDHLSFSKSENIESLAPRFIPLKVSDFTLDDRRPSKIEFTLLSKTMNIQKDSNTDPILYYPSIKLYFTESIIDENTLYELKKFWKDRISLNLNIDAFIQDAFSGEYNVSGLQKKDKIKEAQWPTTSDSYRNNIYKFYKLQDYYGNTVRKLWRVNKQILTLERDQNILLHHMKGLNGILDIYNKVHGMIQERENELKNDLKNELPPPLLLQIAGYKDSGLKSIADEEYDLLSLFLNSKANEEYLSFLKVQEALKAKYCTVLDSYFISIPFCDPNMSKQLGVKYYITTLYAIEGISDLSTESLTYIDERENLINKNELYLLDIGKKELLIFDGISFCEEKDKETLNTFLTRANDQKNKVETLKNSWDNFFESQKKFKNKIRENKDIEKELIEDKGKIERKKSKLYEEYNNIENKKTKLISLLNDLKQRVNKDREAYIAEFSNQLHSVVAEGIGATEEMAVNDLLKNGVEIAENNFKRCIIKVVSGLNNNIQQDMWKENIRSEIMEITPLAWLRNRDNFIITALLECNVKIDKEQVIIRDYEAEIRKDFIISFQGKEGTIYRDHFERKEWWHIGYGNSGYTYKEAQSFCTKNGGGWSIPSIAELKSIRIKQMNRISLLPEIDDKNPYWTSEKAKNGNPLGYCFGTSGDCINSTATQIKDYPDLWALAVILVRDAIKTDIL